MKRYKKDLEIITNMMAVKQEKPDVKLWKAIDFQWMIKLKEIGQGPLTSQFSVSMKEQTIPWKIVKDCPKLIGYDEYWLQKAVVGLDTNQKVGVASVVTSIYTKV